MELVFAILAVLAGIGLVLVGDRLLCDPGLSRLRLRVRNRGIKLALLVTATGAAILLSFFYLSGATLSFPVVWVAAVIGLTITSWWRHIAILTREMRRQERAFSQRRILIPKHR